MNNEPVAWRYKYELDDTSWNFKDDEKLIKSMARVHHIIAEPLYTHPAELTDEEIDKLAKKFGVVGLHEDAGLYEFARAILRKASEK